MGLVHLHLSELELSHLEQISDRSVFRIDLESTEPDPPDRFETQSSSALPAHSVLGSISTLTVSDSKGCVDFVFDHLFIILP